MLCFPLEWSFWQTCCHVRTGRRKGIVLSHNEKSVNKMENGWGRANVYFPSISVAGSASQKKVCASKEMVI